MKKHECLVCSSQRLKAIQNEVDGAGETSRVAITKAAERLGLELSTPECDAIAYHLASGG